MGKLFRLEIALAALSIAAFAQQQPTTGTITTATPGVGNCVSYRAENNSTVGIIVSGTWTGTLTPSLNIFPARAINKKVLPVDGSTAQSTITSAGGGGNFGFVANIGGFAQFQICATSFSSGTAVVDLFATPAPNNSTIAAGGGGGSGTVTNVATTGPISGGPITTTGTISCPTCMVAPSGTLGQSVGNNNGTTGYAATSAFGTSLDTYGIIFSTGATAPTVDQTLAVNNMIAAVCPAVGSGAGCEIDMPANSRVLIHGTAGAQVGIPILTDGVKFKCAGGPGPGYNAAAQHLDGPASCTFETDRPGMYIFGSGKWGGNETNPSAGPQFENITFVDQTANSNAAGALYNVNVNGTTLDNPALIGGFRQTAIAAPSAPACTVSNAGGTISAGAYKVEIAAWTNSGPSLPSAPTTCTNSPIVGNTGSASITIPAPVAPIIGYEVYAAGAGSSTFLTVSPFPTYTTNADGSLTINLQKTTPLSVTANSTSTRGPVSIDLSHSCGLNFEGDLGWLGALNFSNQDRVRNLKAHMVQSAVCGGPSVATLVVENPEFSTCDASASTGACASGAGGVATPGILIGFGTMSIVNPHETGFTGTNASTGNSIAFTGFNNTVTAGTIQGGTGNTATGINMINAKRTMIVGTAVQNYAVGVSADANSTNNFSWFSDNGTNNTLYNDLGAPATNNQWFPSGRNAIFSQSNVANGASINLPPGVAPTTTLGNGDMWTTSAGLFVQINGSTVGPLSAATPPGGSTTQLEYNNGGAFGGVSTWTTNGTTTISGATNSILNWNADVAFSRDAANVLDLGTGAAGNTGGTLKLTTLQTVGSNGGMFGTEGTGNCTPAATTDCLYPDSTLHNWHFNVNNVDKGGLTGLGGTNTGAAGMTLNMSASTTAPSLQFPVVVGGSILAGTSTAALSAPIVFSNTNSSNNNTSITMGITAPGTSTGQTVLNVNNASTGGDIADFGISGTWTAGVLSGQTIKAAIKNSGAIALGAANCVTFGTAGAICASEGTSPTNVASTAAIYPDSTAHELEAATNGSTSFGILNRSVPAAANETGKVATDSAKAICTASAGGCNVAGQYVVNLNVWGSGTACSSVTAGSVVFTMTWVDEQGTTHTAVPMAPFYDYKSAAVNSTGTFNFNTALTTEGANVTMPIGINGSAAPTVTATYTACTTGTGTYNFRATMSRLQ